MFSGNLSRTALYSLFRLLSVKRRQGILEISYDGKSLNIVLSEGLIDHVLFSNGAELKYLIETLLRAGSISNQVAKTVLTQHRSLDASYLYLVDNNHVSKDCFMAAKRCYERNLLHNLRVYSQAKYSFSPKVVAANKELALNAAPGQILLDIIEFEQEAQIYDEYFRADQNPQLARIGSRPTVKLTNDEQYLWNLVGQGIALKTLSDKAVLSQFDLIRALLGLYTHRVLKVDTKVYKDRQTPATTEQEAIKKPVAVVQEEEDFIQDAARLLKSMEGEAVTPQVETIAKPVIVSDKDVSAMAVPQPEIDIQPLVESVIKAENVISPIGSISLVDAKEKLSLRQRLVKCDQWMLDEKNRFNAALFVMMAFMYMLALVVPSQLNNWLEILSKFSALGL